MDLDGGNTEDDLIYSVGRPNILYPWITDANKPITVQSSDFEQTTFPFASFQTGINPEDLKIKVVESVISGKPLPSGRAKVVSIPISKKVQEEPKLKKKRSMILNH